MTPKAQEEIDTLKLAADVLISQATALRTKSYATSNRYECKALQKESVQLRNKAYRKEEKILHLERMGYSSLEQKAIMKEADAFIIVESERSMGSTSVIKVGFSKTASQLIKVEVHKFTDFMRNVRGCGGLAGKKELNYIVPITQEEIDELKTRGKISRTLFCGNHETTTPIAV